MILELRLHFTDDVYFGDAKYYSERLLELSRDDRPRYKQIYSPGQKGKGRLKTDKGTGLHSINSQPKPACSLFGEVPNNDQN